MNVLLSNLYSTSAVVQEYFQKSFKLGTYIARLHQPNISNIARRQIALPVYMEMKLSEILAAVDQSKGLVGNHSKAATKEPKKIYFAQETTVLFYRNTVTTDDYLKCLKGTQQYVPTVCWSVHHLASRGLSLVLQ